MKAVEILRTAAELVGGERAEQHGDMLDLHTEIATLWSAYLGRSVEATDVAWMMVLLKMCRDRIGGPNPDNFIDAAGYCGIAGQLAPEDE